MTKNTSPNEHLAEIRSQLEKIYDNKVAPLEGIETALAHFEAYCACDRVEDDREEYLKYALSQALEASLDIKDIEECLAEGKEKLRASLSERLTRILQFSLASNTEQRTVHTGNALEITRQLQHESKKENPGSETDNNR